MDVMPSFSSVVSVITAADPRRRDNRAHMRRIFTILSGCLAPALALVSAAHAQSPAPAPERKAAAIAAGLKSCTATLPTAFQLFPGDDVDAQTLCRCALDKAGDDARVVEALEQEDFRVNRPGQSHAYAAARLASSFMTCKAEQLDALAKSGALNNLPAAPKVSGIDPPPAYAGGPASCQPKWPPQAIAARASGTTTLVFEVSAEGNTGKFSITRTSGDTLAHKLLDVYAVAAIAECKFKPGMRDGKPVEATATQSFKWMLD